MYLLSATGTSSADDAATAVFVIVLLVYLFFVLSLAIVSYIFQSIGAKRMADNRGMKYSWLAWIPIGNLYIFGELSSDREDGNKGMKFLVTGIILTILSVVPILGILSTLALIIIYAVILYNIFDKYTKLKGMHTFFSLFVPLYLPILLFVKRNVKAAIGTQDSDDDNETISDQ